MPWPRFPHCLSPGCCICKPLPVCWDSSLRVALDAFPSHPNCGGGGLDGPAPPGSQEGATRFSHVAHVGWPHAKAAAECLTACLNRKEGKGNRKSCLCKPMGEKLLGAAQPRSSTSSSAAPGKSLLQAASFGGSASSPKLCPSTGDLPGTSGWAGSLLETHPSKLLPRWAGNPEALEPENTPRGNAGVCAEPVKLWEWWLLRGGILTKPRAVGTTAKRLQASFHPPHCQRQGVLRESPSSYSAFQ